MPDAWQRHVPSVDACADLLAELVRRPSPSGHEQPVQQFIAEWLAGRGLDVTTEAVPDGLVNVVATVTGSGPGPTLLFCGHADTVSPAQGWETDPHTPVRTGDRLYGVGAMDMKAGLATAMLTMAALAELRDEWRGKVMFASVADEEAYSRGAKALVAGGLKADAAILCEPHFDRATLGGVGKVLVEVEVTGRSAHGSYPERGINAVVEASRLVAALSTLDFPVHPEVGRGSQCVLGIWGGPEAYAIQVPDSCRFSINWHIVPGETADTVKAQLDGLIASLQSPASFTVTIKDPYYPPYAVPQTDPFVAQFAAAHRHVLGRDPVFAYSRAVSDGNYLVADAGIPTVTFGPGGENMHAANEWANVAEMPQAMAVYLQLAHQFLQ